MFFHLAMLELKRRFFKVAHTAEVDLTDACNLRCHHCYHFDGKDEFQKDRLSLDVWRKRFGQLYKKGIRFVLLVGGEPALRQDVLRLADEIFPYIYVITNGTIKIPSEFQHTLFVSMDGKENANDAIRGKGVFAKIIKNYSGDNRVIINMTVNMRNYQELEDVVWIAKNNGFRGVVCNLYTPTLGKTNPMFINEKQRKIIINEFKRVKSQYPGDFLHTKKMIQWYEFPDHRGYCYWGDNVLHFDVTWKTRRCFGDKADCSNCGCLAGSIQNPIAMINYPMEMSRFHQKIRNEDNRGANLRKKFY